MKLTKQQIALLNALKANGGSWDGFSNLAGFKYYGAQAKVFESLIDKGLIQATKPGLGFALTLKEE